MTINKSFSPKQWANINTAEQIRTVTNRIVEMGIDITAGYNRWRNIAFGISLEMGEEGRSFFHDISRFYADYNHKECDKLYDDCIKRLNSNSNHSGISIASFFGYAKEAGVNITMGVANSTKNAISTNIAMMQTLQTLQMMQTQKNPSLCQPSATK